MLHPTKHFKMIECSTFQVLSTGQTILQYKLIKGNNHKTRTYYMCLTEMGDKKCEMDVRKGNVNPQRKLPIHFDLIQAKKDFGNQTKYPSYYHQCVFSIPILINQINTNNDLDFEIAFCLVEMNISYRQVPTFFRTIHKCMHYQQMHPNIPPEINIKLFSPQQYSLLIIRVGKYVQQQQIQQLINKRVCIVLDSAKEHLHHQTLVLLINPYSKPPSVIIFAMDTGNTSKQSFQQLGARVVQDCCSLRIRGVCFVTDGLKRQVEALSYQYNDNYTKYLQQTSTTSNNNTLTYIQQFQNHKSIASIQYSQITYSGYQKFLQTLQINSNPTSTSNFTSNSLIKQQQQQLYQHQILNPFKSKLQINQQKLSSNLSVNSLWQQLINSTPNIQFNQPHSQQITQNATQTPAVTQNQMNILSSNYNQQQISFFTPISQNSNMNQLYQNQQSPSTIRIIQSERSTPILIQQSNNQFKQNTSATTSLQTTPQSQRSIQTSHGIIQDDFLSSSSPINKQYINNEIFNQSSSSQKKQINISSRHLRHKKKYSSTSPTPSQQSTDQTISNKSDISYTPSFAEHQFTSQQRRSLSSTPSNSSIQIKKQKIHQQINNNNNQSMENSLPRKKKNNDPYYISIRRQIINNGEEFLFMNNQQLEYELNSPFHSPCLPHDIQLSFTHLYRNNIFVRDIINSAKDLIYSLHSSSTINAIFYTPPTFSPTRWMDITRCLQYMLDREEIIRIKTDIGFNEFALIKQLYVCLEPLRALIEQFESTSSIMINSFPAFIQVFQYYQSLQTYQSNKNQIPLQQEFLQLSFLFSMSLFQLTLGSQLGVLHALAFFMTYSGRNIMSSGILNFIQCQDIYTERERIIFDHLRPPEYFLNINQEKEQRIAQGIQLQQQILYVKEKQKTNKQKEMDKQGDSDQMTDLENEKLTKKEQTKEKENEIKTKKKAREIIIKPTTKQNKKDEPKSTKKMVKKEKKQEKQIKKQTKDKKSEKNDLQNPFIKELQNNTQQNSFIQEQQVEIQQNGIYDDKNWNLDEQEEDERYQQQVILNSTPIIQINYNLSPLDHILSINWNQLAKNLYVQMIREVYKISDMNLIRQSVSILETFWAGADISESMGTLEKYPQSFWIIQSQSQDPAMRILATFAADILTVTSSEADVERAFSQLSLLIGHWRDNLSTESLFYLISIRMYLQQLKRK